jgi:glycosyltransferase involved in cell wall biosynthesis
MKLGGRMKRIAFLYDHVLDIGGVENYLLAMSQRMDRQRYEFVIFSRCSDEYRQRAQAMGIEIVDIRPMRAFDPRAVVHLMKLCRSWKVDLLHIHGAIAATPGRLAAHWIGIPVVVTFHLPAVLYHGSRSSFRARMGRWISIRLDQMLNFLLKDPLIYVSETTRQAEIQAGRTPETRSLVIYNGINLERFARRSEKETKDAPPIVVTFVGRLDTQKGCDVLLNAIAQLPLDLPPVEFWLVGGGPREEELQQQAHQLGLKHVRFLGTRMDIPEILAASDIFVLPSRFEGMPVSLLEAMSAGLACLVTDVGENRRVIRDGVSGIVVEPENSQEISSAMLRLIRDDPLRERLSLEAWKDSKKYSEVETARQVQSIYDAALGFQGNKR